MDAITAEAERRLSNGILLMSVLPFVVWVGNVIVGAL